MRSVAGCITCRRRKLKCDEVQPICGHCRKASKECEPGGLVFRHQQNASLCRGGDGLNKYFSNRGSFSSSTVWMPVTEQVTFVEEDPGGISKTSKRETRKTMTEITVENGGQQEVASSDTQLPAERQGKQQSTTSWQIAKPSSHPNAICSPSTPKVFDNSAPSPPSGQSLGGSSLSFNPSFNEMSMQVDMRTSVDSRLYHNLEFMLNPASSRYGFHRRRDSNETFVSGDLYAESPQSHFSGASQRARAVEADPKVAFLLRHFSEVPGKWLDLYFSEAYFEVMVPMKALSQPLLRYAACAYAAKHLSRTRNKTDFQKVPVRQSHVPTTTSWPNPENVDWAWYGAKYYSQAIKLLRETLKRAHEQLPATPSTELSAATPHAGHIEPDEEANTVTEISDETLAAMAILCNFEFMSASDTEWTRHLSGTMLVLDLQHTGVISLINPSPSQSRKAIFWNFFRQDVYAAFILETKTRLDMDDLAMWRAAGLQIDEQGLVMPSNGLREGAMRDDMISNALLWILAKIFNYIADNRKPKGKAGDLATSPGPATDSPEWQHSQWKSRRRWDELSHEVDVWYDGLPDWYQPCARVERSATEPATKSSPCRPITIPDIWFPSAMCASAIQTYHLARMLLVVHKPEAPVMDGGQNGAVFHYINRVRNVEAELRFRSREIFGIAIASPTTSITLHQTQTIFIAAQCLTDNDERCMALDILRRVNSDLGWETEYRVQQLLKEWGWEMPEA